MIGTLLRKARHWWRSSVTGRFVSKEFAEAHKDITEEEHDAAKLIDRFKRDA